MRITEPSSDDDDENYQKTDHNVLSKSITILGNITWYISRILKKKSRRIRPLHNIYGLPSELYLAYNLNCEAPFGKLI